MCLGEGYERNGPLPPTPHIRACLGSWRTVSSYSLPFRRAIVSYVEVPGVVTEERAKREEGKVSAWYGRRVKDNERPSNDPPRKSL